MSRSEFRVARSDEKKKERAQSSTRERWAGGPRWERHGNDWVDEGSGGTKRQSSDYNAKVFSREDCGSEGYIERGKSLRSGCGWRETSLRCPTTGRSRRKDRGLSRIRREMDYYPLFPGRGTVIGKKEPNNPFIGNIFLVWRVASFFWQPRRTLIFMSVH